MERIDPAIELQNRLWAWMDEQEDLIQAVREEPTTTEIEVRASWRVKTPENRAVGMRRDMEAK